MQTASPTLFSLTNQGFCFRAIVEESLSSKLPMQLNPNSGPHSDKICRDYKTARKKLYTGARELDGETIFFAKPKIKENWVNSMSMLVNMDNGLQDTCQKQTASSWHHQCNSIKWQRIHDLWFLYNSIEYAVKKENIEVLKIHLQDMQPKVNRLGELLVKVQGLYRHHREWSI